MGMPMTMTILQFSISEEHSHLIETIVHDKDLNYFYIDEFLHILQADYSPFPLSVKTKLYDLFRPEEFTKSILKTPKSRTDNFWFIRRENKTVYIRGELNGDLNRTPCLLFQQWVHTTKDHTFSLLFRFSHLVHTHYDELTQLLDRYPSNQTNTHSSMWYTRLRNLFYFWNAYFINQVSVTLYSVDWRNNKWNEWEKAYTRILRVFMSTHKRVVIRKAHTILHQCYHILATYINQLYHGTVKTYKNEYVYSTGVEEMTILRSNELRQLINDIQECTHDIQPNQWLVYHLLVPISYWDVLNH